MKILLPLFLLIISHLNAFGQTGGGHFADEIAQHRETYKKDFLENERSPLDSADLPNLRFFEPDERYRVACTFRRTPDEQPFDLPTYSGITRPYVKYGVLAFEIEGRKLQLAVYQNLTMRNMPQYAQHLFLPFRDATNDETTYGGGRYLDLLISDVEGEAPVLDFNKCYNPWCHYSDGYNCPIPPTENHLDIAIEAGEKLWVGEKKH
ncbi:MAG: DUF1684 domain-containing protein [Bacteroidetes bacterium]|nr:DUF1684 domain-containing protein [Bacteroidota bacterium]